jgi:branched-chain amino acid transport system ATP-binding protein
VRSILGSHRRQDRAVTEFAHHQLRRVGMERFADSLPGQLSIGRQKLASLARALMNNGSCLFLDEPVAGVEGAAYEVLKQLIREEAAAGRGICIVEHNISFVDDLCDDCAFMFNGSIMAEGSISELINNPYLTGLYFGSHK